MKTAKVSTYKDLQVWKAAVKLAAQAYETTQKFPAGEKFGLSSQVQRSAVSIAANIAEGWGRGSTKEYIQFLLIARGSLFELQTHLHIARELKYLTVDELESGETTTDEMGRMLNGLIRSLRRIAGGD